jgi:hypothetical protein
MRTAAARAERTGSGERGVVNGGQTQVIAPGMGDQSLSRAHGYEQERPRKGHRFRRDSADPIIGCSAERPSGIADRIHNLGAEWLEF